MDKLGSLVALSGAGLCLVAGVARLMGFFHLAGFEAITLFGAGTSLMIFSIVIKLYCDKLGG